MGWRTIEHTADLGLEVEAPTLGELFLGGAHGMMGVLLGSEAGSLEGEVGAAAGWRGLEVEAPDLEALFVGWLREILYIQITEELLFVAAELEELGETSLVARVGFAPPADASAVERELKGVTYHDLEVSRRGGGWFARVVFDL
jgi:SHS2 domain-containing protein